MTVCDQYNLSKDPRPYRKCPLWSEAYMYSLGIQSIIRLFPDCACLTRPWNPWPPPYLDFSHFTLLLLTSSSSPMIITTSTRGCRLTGNANMDVISSCHSQPICLFFLIMMCCYLTKTNWIAFTHFDYSITNELMNISRYITDEMLLSHIKISNAPRNPLSLSLCYTPP